ncbi:MAG: hypothetical protein CVU69_02670 [Deltaproteobacteria bacterium HGW-Deltaproteobacteria-4]|nr:MAG: hypothetical protein CVU69_02670 [Deltaproteobacteria bacterium HGW-Deltaproteobacteria-4]
MNKKNGKRLMGMSAAHNSDGGQCQARPSSRVEERKQTLLFVDYAVPMYDRFAGSRTNYMYLVLLVKMGMKVKFLPADFKHVEPYSAELNNLGIEVLAGEWFSNNWEEWFKEKGQEIDYIFLNKPNPSIKFLDAIHRYTRAAILYQCHDLHFLRLQRQGQLNGDHSLLDEARFYEEKEDYIFGVSDALLTFSTVEEKIIRNKFPQKQVFTVPLFFYDDVPEPKYNFSSRRDLLYVGGFDHAPNRDAVAWFCREVFPLVLRQSPEIVLNVVGANPPKEISSLQSDNVKILGKVSDEELQGLYDQVRLSVIPLRFGAGVKGKTIETMYHGVPLISTSIGLEGIEGIEQIASPKDESETFATEILALYQDEVLWRDRSLQGAKFVAEHFTSLKTAELMSDIFTSSKDVVAARMVAAPAVNPEEDLLRLIALYLPQYHPILENDKWWGKGFTEWRNVCKAAPLFPGHYQPHIPADLGFYDLRLEEARIAQAELAREYGIHGFCYYHYWFNGRRLLERPAEEMLASGKPDFPFCLCWANENWTRRWDGEDQLVLMEQKYSEEDDREHIRDLFRFFRDERYVRINGKPVFFVYRTENIPDPARTASVWREEARQAGIGELYLVRVESIGRTDPHAIGFDAALEFAPDWNNLGHQVNSLAPSYSDLQDVVELPRDVCEKNYIRGYDVMMKRMLEKEKPDYPWFRCVTPAWDNSARRSEGAVVLVNSTPSLYRHWLESVIKSTNSVRKGDERIVFINAWNEWAEGNHLEPCLKWGRTYLEVTKAAIENSNPAASSAYLKGTEAVDKENISMSESSFASLLINIMKETKCPLSIIMSIEDICECDERTYLSGWAFINDNICAAGSEILILLQEPNGRVQLIEPSKRKRPDVTAHFSNRCDYDDCGFEIVVKRIDPNSRITLFIKRDGKMAWADYKSPSAPAPAPSAPVAAQQKSAAAPVLKQETIVVPKFEPVAGKGLLLMHERRIAHLELRAQERERDVAELENIVKDRERSIDALLNSASWKVTAPLRWCHTKFIRRDESS